MRIFAWLILLSTALLRTGAAEFHTTPDSVVITANQAEGAAVLSTMDDFISAVSDFDRSSRMSTDRVPTREEFAGFVSSQVMTWSDLELSRLTTVFGEIEKKFSAFKLPFPKKIFLIKTTGREEGEAAYCRGQNVIIPQEMASGSPQQLQGLLIHELFHILSKSNPELRASLYKVVGFLPCNDIKAPDELAARLITNPDAPTRNFYATLVAGGQSVNVVPILFTKLKKYDPTRDGSFFDSLTFRFMVITQTNNQWAAELVDGKPRLLDPKEIEGLNDKLGPNPGPILQPEEVLAAYFVPLISGNAKAVPEKIANGMRECLR